MDDSAGATSFRCLLCLSQRESGRSQRHWTKPVGDNEKAVWYFTGLLILTCHDPSEHSLGCKVPRQIHFEPRAYSSWEQDAICR